MDVTQKLFVSHFIDPGSLKNIFEKQVAAEKGCIDFYIEN